MSPITVAIAGGTGTFGQRVVQAFLSSQYYPAEVNRVVVFTRDSSSVIAQELKAIGAEIQTKGPDVQTMSGVDVAVNALLGPGVIPVETHNSFARAAAAAGTKVFFSDDFGLDFYTHKHDTKLFDLKIACNKYAGELEGGQMKVISLMPGPFLEYGWVVKGLDTANRLYSAPGSVDTKVSFTSWEDVGASIVRLSLLALQDSSTIPDVVRLSGDAKSWRELANIVGDEIGEKIETKSIDPLEFKNGLGPFDAMGTIRLCLASGLVDQSKENHNELVNPEQRYWKWKTVDDYVKETKGSTQ